MQKYVFAIFLGFITITSANSVFAYEKTDYELKQECEIDTEKTVIKSDKTKLNVLPAAAV